MKKKTIGVDLRCLPADGTRGAGIEHAAFELWMKMRELSPAYSIELIGFAARGAMVPEEGIEWLQNGRGSSLWRAITNHRLDGLFVPSGAVAWGVSIPVFPWVHDLAIFDHPDWFPQSWMKRQLTTTLFLRGLKRASHIFSVSQNTKQAIQRVGGIPFDKITVTYQGSDVLQVPGGQTGIPTPYALILGTVEPRKNILFITNIWPEVERRLGRAYPLVIAGKNGWGDIRLAAHPSIIRREKVEEGIRDELIRGASVLLLPSLHEGFGRLALEAMQLGTPLIASDRGALPEVIGEGGMIRSLEAPEAWIQAILELISHPQRQAEWREKGRVQAQKFSWEAVARTILARLGQN